ncbi:MAG: GTP-binding protein [Thermodesulfobacteriota bacterium]|nr:GTP-binding protein [Thermodesulfobacteriota bacterium]
MKIVTADFLTAAERQDGYPRGGLREIAFAGRSNVGKSSMINSLLGRKNLVRTSKTPGRTRKLNFFLINAQFIFVDLPGYGYAAVSQTERESWGSMVQTYLESRKELGGVVVILDARHAFMESDRNLIEYLSHRSIRFLVACTKVDKLTKSKISLQKRMVLEILGDSAPLIMFSAHTGEGKNELWKAIRTLIAG